MDLLEVSVQFAGFADEVFIVRNTRLRKRMIMRTIMGSLSRKLIIISFFIMIVIITITISMC